MYCPECGNQVEGDSSSICTSCGVALGESAPGDLTKALIGEEDAVAVPAAPSPAVVVNAQHATNVYIDKKNHGILIRALWFIFVGWWVGQFAILIAWFFNALVITLPIGLIILNRLPQIFTLRSTSQSLNIEHDAEQNTTTIRLNDVEQRPFWQRALYFILVGWWFSLVWLEIAWLCGITIILLPVSFAMFSMSAAITTLRRN